MYFCSVQEGIFSNVMMMNTDLLSHLICLATSTSLCLDLVAHQHVLQLTGNLLCGNILFAYIIYNLYVVNILSFMLMFF